MREGRICGLVVSEPRPMHPYIMQAVFVDKNSPMLFTRRYDLTDRPYRSRLERKYVEKKDKERNLLPGDWIEFGAPRGGYIRDYEKVFPLCENRVIGGKLQVESICVFSPRTENVQVICMSELFGRVAVSVETSERFLANVALKCWLCVEVYRMTLTVTFSEFISVANDQSFVAATPWNRGDPRFAIHIGHDGEVLSKVAMLHSDLPNHLCDACGLLVNERTVYCSRYAQIPIQLACVVQPCEVNIGDRIKFQAMFSIFLNGYVVNAYRKLEVSVKWEGLPFGYVWTRNKQLGIVHDPEGILSAALLSSLRLSVFRVYVTDTGPSAFSRFRLRELASTLSVDGDSLTKNGHMFVGKLIGISTGNGSIFAPKYGTLKIHFGMKSTAGWEQVKPGSWISFTMASDPQPPLFTVIEWERISKLPVQCFLTPDDYQFQTRVRFNSLLSVLESEVFGFIDDPHEKLPLSGRNGSGDDLSVWVKQGNAACRTPFILASVDEPVLPCVRANCSAYRILCHLISNPDVVSSFTESYAEDLLQRIRSALTLDDH
uniref:Uncharacterized protein n=1 Tax=Ascaris lumbricoides TaxID=6252 RepID=A0A9J2PGL4_ASCLU